VLSILTTLGKQTELAAHVRGAVNNGLTEDEIKEILLQCMVYAGLPTGLEAFRTADGVLRKIEQEAKEVP
jgi:4-carboxymuconolactone decarboxylase